MNTNPNYRNQQNHRKITNHRNQSNQTIKQLILAQLIAGILIIICLLQYRDTRPSPTFLTDIDNKITDSSDIHSLEEQLRSIFKKLELIN